MSPETQKFQGRAPLSSPKRSTSLRDQEGAAQARAPLGVKAYGVEVVVDGAVFHLTTMCRGTSIVAAP